MSGILASIDEFGPEIVVQVGNDAAGLQAVVVIDNTAMGPSIGGVRMAPDVTLDECARLARAMNSQERRGRPASWRWEISHSSRPGHAFGRKRTPDPCLRPVHR